MKILGVDPGIHGGLAIVDLVDGAPGARVVDAIDIPTVGLGVKERVDVAAVRDFIAKHGPQHALIERAQAMPNQGASSGFKYGRAVGAIEAAIVCSGIPLTIIEPTAWKKFHGLRGGDKVLSITSPVALTDEQRGAAPRLRRAAASASARCIPRDGDGRACLGAPADGTVTNCQLAAAIDFGMRQVLRGWMS
jgi:Holliday junction resolvasome RuvABC endonuclease subunit